MIFFLNFANEHDFISLPILFHIQGPLNPTLNLPVTSYIWNIIWLFSCKSSIVTINISHLSKIRMESSINKLLVEFIHEYSNMECDMVKELLVIWRHLNKGLESQSNGDKVIIPIDFFCNIKIGLRVHSYVFPNITIP